MHILQRKIIEQLIYHPTRRYAQLRPAGTDSNLFAYHLKRVIAQGYVKKSPEGYVLTYKGMANVDRLSGKTMLIRWQPKIITLAVIANEAGQTLLVRRARQPYIDMLSLPSGKLHEQEPIAQAAVRELQEKTGLQNVPLTHKGIMRIQINQADYCLTEVMAHIFAGQITANVTAMKGEWHAADTLSSDVMPGTRHVIKAAKQLKFFYEEKTFYLK